MRVAKALLAAAAAAIALAGTTTTRAQTPVYVKVTAAGLGPLYPELPQVYFVFSVTNNLGGTNKIYEFDPDALVVYFIGAPAGFEPEFGPPSYWIDNDYGTAIGPGQTGYFSGILYNYPIPSSFQWGVSVENSASDTNPVFFSGVVETNVPELSSWAMMLLGFAGLGFAGYGAHRRGAAST